jgi:hypothetical protein
MNEFIEVIVRKTYHNPFSKKQKKGLQEALFKCFILLF